MLNKTNSIDTPEKGCFLLTIVNLGVIIKEKGVEPNEI
ncbi:hypothetical protein JMA_37800 (plasmid) [Jeotgalibacillus malaysiensis]|uniref:Uncharacterized protein n=1 Tax=Jeotgalibacillus malaysiensis TaxID=1508404 RepID=A0A0B5AWZ3_9BACL|nr:hypothetical protein JMA_37800 [Jeotgalibacillus malaysiensis]